MDMDERLVTTPDRRFGGMSISSISLTGKRAVVATATLALAYAAGAAALSQAALMTAPDIAMQVAPVAGLADAITADRLMIANGANTDLAVVQQLAKRSLFGQPLNPVALRILGYVADTRGDRAQAMRLLTLSEKVGRRDLGTQFALIQYAAEAGDLPRTLKHYDILMRTSVHGQTILFPILARGLSDPEIRDGLVPMLDPPPPWFWPFINHVIGNKYPTADLARLLGATMKTLPDSADYRAFHGRLLTALVIANEAKLAAIYYLTLPGSQPMTLKTVGITSVTTEPRFAPITWQTSVSASAGATVEAGGRAFVVSANSREKTSVLRRILFLAPGSYRIGIDQRQIAAADGHKLTWTLACGANPVWTETLAASQRGQEGGFIVPSDCASQMIALELTGSADQSVVEYRVEDIRIRRVSS